MGGVKNVAEQDRIFLSPEEALNAIRTDFNLYPPQTRLFLELSPLILGRNTSVVEDPRHDGIWVAVPGGRPVRRMRLMAPGDLGNLLCDTLADEMPGTEILADICAGVFQVTALPGKEWAGGRDGIWIDRRMQNFKCRQCGHCCRELEFNDSLNEADYRKWEELGRDDILAWVGTTRRNGETVSRAIWILPGTRQFATTCPWLEKIRGEERWGCRIHDVKPEICRQYPGTRKHARMTGCGAFGSE